VAARHPQDRLCTSRARSSTSPPSKRARLCGHAVALEPGTPGPA
jgi:hypothetical protein